MELEIEAVVDNESATSPVVARTTAAEVPTSSLEESSKSIEAELAAPGNDTNGIDQDEALAAEQRLLEKQDKLEHEAKMAELKK